MDAGLLHVLSLRGYQKLVTVVLAERGADVNAQGGRYGNALQAASASGHAEIVRQLLERGADVNAQGGQYGNALQAASAERYFGNALQAASAERHAEILRQLLERGAEYGIEDSADV